MMKAAIFSLSIVAAFLTLVAVSAARASKKDPSYPCGDPMKYDCLGCSNKDFCAEL